MVLIKGNHDILEEGIYQSTNLKICDELKEGPFHFTHESVDTELYNFSGHIHPGIRLKGKARQGATLPCFYFEENSALVPAFGDFTGVYKIKPAKGSKIFVIAEGVLFGINP